MLSTSSNVTASTITELASRNALVVKTTEPNMRDVKHMIESMDIPSKQVCVEAKFLELSESASKQLGIRWDSLESFGVKLGAGPFTYNRNSTRDNNNSASASHNTSDTATRTTSDLATETSATTYNDKTLNMYRMPLNGAPGKQFEEVKTEFVEAPPGSGNYLAQSTITPTHQQTFGTDYNKQNNLSDNTQNESIDKKLTEATDMKSNAYAVG